MGKFTFALNAATSTDCTEKCVKRLYKNNYLKKNNPDYGADM